VDRKSSLKKPKVIRKSRRRAANGKKKTDKRTKNDVQNITQKYKDRANELHVVLLLLQYPVIRHE